MSVNAGSKPIVTDKLIHVYDPLSPVSYPSGSETFRNHFSEAHVKKVTNGFGTNSDNGTDIGFAKNGLAEYGAETDHQRQKGYFEADDEVGVIFQSIKETIDELNEITEEEL